MRTKLPPLPWPKNSPRAPIEGGIGTGDIIDPSERLYDITPEGERDRYIPTRADDWASINEKASKASTQKREWLADQLAKGEIRTPAQVKKAALKLGCRPEDIEKQKLTPAMARAVAERLRALAAIATALALPYQAELAKTDVASFDKIARIGEVLKPSAGVQINTVNDNRRNGGDDEGDRQFFKRFQQRTQQGLALVQPVEPDTSS